MWSRHVEELTTADCVGSLRRSAGSVTQQQEQEQLLQ
jgi:hypothetical protein